MEQILRDLKHSLRSLARNPGFAAVAILTLALGIGANTAIFSVVDSVLLRSLPFREPARLVTVWLANHQKGGAKDLASYPIFEEWKKSGALADMAAFVPLGANLTGEGPPERVKASMVSANLFHLMGVAPELGRGFMPREEQPGEDGKVVLSHGLWMRHFGSDPKILDRIVRVGGRSLVVVGVMPARFDFPSGAELWIPLAPSPDMRAQRGALWLYTVARVRPEAGLAQAQAAMEAVEARIAREDPGLRAFGAAVRPLREYFVGDVRPALLVLLCAVAFVLLIACANIANLLLARAAAREQEIAVRSALGASRVRMLRQLLTESIVLSLLGGALGLLLAGWAGESLRRLAPPSLPQDAAVAVDLRVLGFTLAVSVLTGILFGLAPALQVSRPHYSEALKERSTGGSRQRKFTLNALVVAEVALALVLLVAAGLLIQSFSRLERVDLGFRPQGLLTTSMTLTSRDYPEPAQVASLYQRVLERVEALPGVQSVGMTSAFLLSHFSDSRQVFVEGRPAPPPEERVEVNFDAVSPGFFRTLGTPLLQGRLFTVQDGEKAVPVAVVNRTMARRLWPSESPIGKRFRFSPDEPAMTVIGMIGDMRRSELEQEEPPSCFLPFAQLPTPNMTFVVRTAGDPVSLAGAVKQAVWTVDRNQPITRVATAEELLSERLSLRRFNALLLAFFSLLALLLAAVGIYGVISYTVSQSLHDIGIRMALGAQSEDVLRMVFAKGLGLVAIGVAVGFASALAAGRILSHLLFGVKATDPLTFLGVAAILGLLASVAMYLPARRAARVDPVRALRAGG